MRRAPTVIASLALVVALAACGSDNDGGGDTTAPPTTRAETTTSEAATTTAPPTTAERTTTSAPTTTAPSTTAADPGRIEVDADTIGDTPMTATVPLGTSVTLVVHSATPQEFHLHGYDITATGTDVNMQFTADQAGGFELESHDTEKVFLVLTVG
jgi:cytoskeletal protein RodZ